MTGSLLSVRIPDDLKARLEALCISLAAKTGGVEQDFSKVVRHVLLKGLMVVEREVDVAVVGADEKEVAVGG